MRSRSGLMIIGLLAWMAVASAQAPDLERMDIVLKSVPDGPVAKVYDQNISAGEFVSLYRTELASLALQSGKKDLPDDARISTALRCLAVLVQREVLHQEVLKRKLAVTEEEVEKQWDAELERVGRGFRDEGETPFSEEKVLKWAGMSRDEALEEVRKEMLIAKVREQVVDEARPKVTDVEVADYFEEKKGLFRRPDQYQLRQIFAGFGPKGVEAEPEVKLRAREKIVKAMKRVRAGERFEAVAKAMSEAPDREEGGDLGLLPVPALPPFFVDAAASLQSGRISDIIESEFGYHIIQLIKYVPGAEPNLEKATPLIRKMLLAKKSAEIVDAFCDPVLDDKGAVQVFLEIEKNIGVHPEAAELLRRKPAKAKAD